MLGARVVIWALDLCVRATSGPHETLGAEPTLKFHNSAEEKN